MTVTNSALALNRRRLLQLSVKLSAAAALTPWLSACELNTEKIGDSTMLLSGYRDSPPNASNPSTTKKRYGIAGIYTDGRLAFDIAVPQRVHDSLVLPQSQQAIFFARRPGTHFYVVDLNSREITHTISAPLQRHFYGHGAVSHDGRYLFTSENAFDRQQGRIAVYDIADNFKRLDEFSSGGVGPHQIALLSDQKNLVVANGGILTHPARGRKKLNIATMQPSLSYLDSQSGQVIDSFKPPHHQQSIRHIDVGADDQVAIGIQFEGESSQQLPLGYTHHGEDQLQALQASDLDWQRHQQYIGSVCMNPEASHLLLSSPRGDIVSRWNLRSRSLESIHTQRDGAGLAFTPNKQQFFVSNGIGQISALGSAGLTQANEASTVSPFYFAHRSWDNHMSVVNPLSGATDVVNPDEKIIKQPSVTG